MQTKMSFVRLIVFPEKELALQRTDMDFPVEYKIK